MVHCLPPWKALVLSSASDPTAPRSLTWAAVFYSKIISLFQYAKTCFYPGEQQRAQYWIIPMHINSCYHEEDMILYRYVYTFRWKEAQKWMQRCYSPWPQRFQSTLVFIAKNVHTKHRKSCTSHICWSCKSIIHPAPPQLGLSVSLKQNSGFTQRLEMDSSSPVSEKIIE